MLEWVLKALRAVRLTRAGMSELEIQMAISCELLKWNIPHRREVRIASRCRVDILVDGGIVVELKKSRPERAAVEAQLERYAQVPGVTAVVLLLERAILLPEEMHGVPVRVHSLNSNWGVAV